MGALLESLSSYDTNIMLAAIIFLLLVILFVVLLHIYAKWFLSRARHLRRAPPPPVTHLVMVPSSRAFPYTSATTSSSKGVEASAIASIPMFVYGKQAQVRDEDEDCVICLSGFQEGEAGRRLPGCGHAFHVACIDTWLRSHTTCPVCRKEHDAVEEEAAAVLEGVVVIVSTQSQPQHGGDTNDASLSTSSASILSVPSNSSSISNNNNSSSSTSTSTSLGSSLKRILSRNRSERSKVFPSSVNVNDAAADDQLDV